jgi:hypothetical protein
MLKLFTQNIFFFCHNKFFLKKIIFRALWSKFTFQKNIKNEFSTLYLGFEKWTFINVQK